jgi:hypothetical protein
VAFDAGRPLPDPPPGSRQRAPPRGRHRSHRGKDGKEIAHVGERDLQLSDDLRFELADWARRRDDNLDEDYGIADPAIDERLTTEAEDLKRRLRDELGPSFTVT